MSCARAASSPLPQAFKSFVISAVRVSMDSRSPWAPTNIQNAWRVLGPAAACTGEGERSILHLLQKAGSTNETNSNHSADAQSRGRRRLRTTDSGDDDIFGRWHSERDRSKATQHSYLGRESCRERHTGPIHVSTVQSEHRCSATVLHLRGPEQGLFSRCGRRGPVPLH